MQVFLTGFGNNLGDNLAVDYHFFI